ncbi:MAG: hypothetical protein ACD_75C01397G0001, partial [uncultured bacterium]
MRSDLAQDHPNVVGRLVPEFMELRADQRPILHTLRWRRNHKGPGRETYGKLFHPFHGTQAKPGRRPDDNHEIDESENYRCESRTTAKKPGKEMEDGIERNGEYDAPGQNRHKRTDENERPIDQESQQSEPDRKLDEILAGSELANGFQERTFIWSRTASSS